MPNENGYGHSKATPLKQYALDTTLGHVMGSGVMVAKHHGYTYRILDMTAGPGISATGELGSPLIIAKHIMQWVARGYKITLVCVEWNEATLANLREVMATRFPDLPVKYYTSQAEALATIPQSAIGLTYWDPTQYNHLDIELLSDFGCTHYRMDILLTRECLAGYRMQKAAHCKGTLTIQDYLALTGKSRNYIMQYAKHGWWSLGFADNWKDRPVQKMKGFVDVNTIEGMRTWSKWTAGAQPPEIPPGFTQKGLFS